MSDSTGQPTSESVLDLTTQLNQDALQSWSEQKRDEFCGMFDARVRASRYILLATARIVKQKAGEKFFISDRHTKDLPKDWDEIPDDLFDLDLPSGKAWKKGSYVDIGQIGSRTLTELDEIAGERAKEILSSLPQLKTAVEILDPKVARMIEQRDLMIEQGKKLLAESKELSGALDMDDFDDKMPIGSFKALIKERQKKRKAIMEKLDDIGDKGNRLNAKINKFLYEGLPGLSDAVIQVILDHIERAKAFSALSRRVVEKVKFGDSEAATQILQNFEKDELNVSDNIKQQFDAALAKLKLIGSKAKAPRKLTAKR